MTKTYVDTGNPWTWTSRQDTSERDIRRTVALENEVARLKAANELLMIALRPQKNTVENH